MLDQRRKLLVGLYERTKQQYIDKVCLTCNPEELALQMNGEINCPKLAVIMEHNLKEVTNDIAKNIDNEFKLDIRNDRK